MVRPSATSIVAVFLMAAACKDLGADAQAVPRSFAAAPGSDTAPPAAPVTGPGPADPGACPAPPPGSPLADPNLVDRFVWSSLPDLPDGARLAKARALGALPLERVRFLDNEYDPGQKIEERTLVYDGLEITGQVVAGQEFRQWHAKVTKAGWRVRDGLGVGASVNDLARVLGCANTRAGDQLTYSGETESVRFTIREGRIAAVEIFHYHE